MAGFGAMRSVITVVSCVPRRTILFSFILGLLQYISLLTYANSASKPMRNSVPDPESYLRILRVICAVVTPPCESHIVRTVWQRRSRSEKATTIDTKRVTITSALLPRRVQCVPTLNFCCFGDLGPLGGAIWCRVIRLSLTERGWAARRPGKTCRMSFSDLRWIILTSGDAKQ